MRNWSYYVDGGHIPSNLIAEKPRIAFYGCFQIGKSTLINCLMNRYVALTGNGLATTSLTARYSYGDKRLQYMRRDGNFADITHEQLNNLSNLDDIYPDRRFFSLEAHEPAEMLKLCDIVDTPGFQANAADTDAALGILESINYGLFVIPNRGLWDVEKKLLKRLSEHVPVSVIMNCSEGCGTLKWIPSHSINEKILEENAAAISGAGVKTLPLGGEEIFVCNAMFYWSRQAEFNVSKSYIEGSDILTEQIELLLTMKGESTSCENVVALSRIPLLVKCLTARIAKYNPVTHAWR